MKKKEIIFLMVALFILPLFTNIVFGQATPPPPPPPPPGVPIDGGITLLLAGLGGYAYKKFKDVEKT